MKSNAVIASQNSLCGGYHPVRSKTIERWFTFTHAAAQAVDTLHCTAVLLVYACECEGKRAWEWGKNATDWDTEPSEKYLWWVTIVIFVSSSSLLQKCEIVFFCSASFCVPLFSLSWYRFLCFSDGWRCVIDALQNVPFRFPPVVIIQRDFQWLMVVANEWIYKFCCCIVCIHASWLRVFVVLLLCAIAWFCFASCLRAILFRVNRMLRVPRTPN